MKYLMDSSTNIPSAFLQNQNFVTKSVWTCTTNWSEIDELPRTNPSISLPSSYTSNYGLNSRNNINCSELANLPALNDISHMSLGQNENFGHFDIKWSELDDLPAINIRDRKKSEDFVPMLSNDEYELNMKLVMNSGYQTESTYSVNLKRCPDNQSAVEMIKQLSDVQIEQFMKDAYCSKFLQDNFVESREIFDIIYSAVLRDDALTRLAKDVVGNFTIQKLIESTERWNKHLLIADNGNSLFDKLEKKATDLFMNRFSCRIVQKFIDVVPKNRVVLLLGALRGSECTIVTDQNANHVIQRILERFSPDVYEGFFKSLVDNSADEISSVCGDKYGCRVVQKCLERIVDHLDPSADDPLLFNGSTYNIANGLGADRSRSSRRNSVKQDPAQLMANSRAAHNIMQALMPPILKNAKFFIEHEYANYIVQFIIKTPSLRFERNYITCNYVINNILWLAQDKYASHVVEYAFCYADSVEILRVMFDEIFHNYEPATTGRNGRARDALDIMIYDRYANYVVQRMLEIAIEVRQSRRRGDTVWFDILAARISQNGRELTKYSSGKKILQMLVNAWQRIPPRFERCFLI